MWYLKKNKKKKLLIGFGENERKIIKFEDINCCNDIQNTITHTWDEKSGLKIIIVKEILKKKNKIKKVKFKKKKTKLSGQLFTQVKLYTSFLTGGSKSSQLCTRVQKLYVQTWHNTV